MDYELFCGAKVANSDVYSPILEQGDAIEHQWWYYHISALSNEVYKFVFAHPAQKLPTIELWMCSYSKADFPFLLWLRSFDAIMVIILMRALIPLQLISTTQIISLYHRRCRNKQKPAQKYSALNFKYQHKRREENHDEK